MKQFNIVNANGTVIDRVKANDERHALCVFLMKHPELDDMMLYKGAIDHKWLLAEYDYEEYAMTAKPVDKPKVKFDITFMKKNQQLALLEVTKVYYDQSGDVDFAEIIFRIKGKKFREREKEWRAKYN